MRRIAGCIALTVTLVLGIGCRQQCFLTREDFYEGQHLPAHLETDPHAVLEPLIPHMPAPPTLHNPDRPARPLSLQEALAIALENGSPSGRVGIGRGLADDNLLTAGGGAGGSSVAQLVGQADRLRVLALAPASTAANIEASLARFDATWTTSMNWSTTDNLQQGLTSFQNGQNAQFATSITKAFSAGGVGAVSFITDYQQLTTPPTGTFSVVNPLYTTRLNFAFEQPLWQNFGTDINQLLASFPFPQGDASLHQRAANFFSSHLQGRGVFGTFGQVEGILLARLRFDQQRAEFERQVHTLLVNTEVAYWKLYQAYGRLYAFEEIMRVVHRAWMDNLAKYKVGTIGPDQFQPIRGQYEEFRGERMAALGNVLDAERQLRRIIGLPVEDGTRLVPITPPVLAPYVPDWNAALDDALRLRPELIIARDNVRAAQMQVLTQYNFLKPDLRFSANYTPLGFGSTLSGTGTFIDGTGAERPSNAARSLASDHFNNWFIGLTLNIPLGYRAENAAIRQAKISLAQAYFVLKDQEERATSALSQQYQKIIEWWDLIEARRNERQAYGLAVDAKIKALQVGKITVDALLLDLQRRFVLAQVKEYEAIAEYNNSLARFELTKGTILQHDNIVIAEGALPTCAQVRAVEHERERSKALVLCERPEPMRHPGRLTVNGHDLPSHLDLNMPLPPSGLAKESDKMPTKAVAPPPPVAGGVIEPPNSAAPAVKPAAPPLPSQTKAPPPATGDAVQVISHPMLDPSSEDSPWRKSPGAPVPAVKPRGPGESAPAAPRWLPSAEELRAAPLPPPPASRAEPAKSSDIESVGVRSREPLPIAEPPALPAGFSPVPPPLPAGARVALPPPLR